MSEHESEHMGALRSDEPLPRDGEASTSADADRAAAQGEPTEGAAGDTRPQSASADRASAPED